MGVATSPQASGIRARLARPSIRWKLTIVLSLVMVIPTGAFAAWDFIEGRRQMVALAEQKLLADAQGAVQAIEAFLQERRLDIQRQASGPLPVRPAMQGAPGTKAGHRLLEASLEAHRRTYGYLRIALLGADSKPIAATGGPIPIQGSESLETVRRALAGETVVSDPFFAGPEGPFILEIAAPVRDPEGVAHGFLLAALPFDRIAAIVREAGARAGPGGIVGLLDGHMIVIAHGSNPAFVGRPLAPLPENLRKTLIQSQRFGAPTAQLLGEPVQPPRLVEKVQRLRQNPNDSPFFDDRPVTSPLPTRVAVVLLRTKPWALAIGRRYDSLLAPAKASLERHLTMYGVTIGLLALLAWGLGGIMARRLGHLAEATDQLAKGDLSVRVGAGPADEIGRVARSFNVMAQATQEHEAATRERIARLDVLAAVGRAVTSTLNLDEVLSLIVEKAVPATGVDAAAILEADASTGGLRLTRQRGLSLEKTWSVTLQPGESVSGAAIREEGPVWTEDLASEPRFGLSDANRALVARLGIRATLSVPIRAPSGIYGVLSFYRHAPGPFTSNDVQFATLLAAQAGIAIENARAYQEVQRTKGELEAANRELEAFSYSVSHDLRAPLRAVDGFSRILLEEHAPTLAPDVQRYLRMARENAQRMGQLIDNLLAFSRLSRQPLRVRPVALEPLVRQVFDDLRAHDRPRRIELSVGDLPACRADPALLRQVFSNLLSNALKFTRQRDVARIEVGCRTTGAECAYFVRDNGVGFDIRYADKLFGVFQRLHGAEDYEGTGVGLAIVQRIVNRHGGRVWAEAEADKGATFCFTLGGAVSHDPETGGDPAGRG